MWLRQYGKNNASHQTTDRVQPLADNRYLEHRSLFVNAGGRHSSRPYEVVMQQSEKV
jgi:hypothetical protein